MQATPSASLKVRALRRLVTTLAVLAFLLFASAGSWRFWQGWLFVGLMATLWSYFLTDLLRRSPQLLERRLRHEEVEAAQKVFQRIFVPVTLAAFSLTGLAFRFGWSRHWLGSVPLAVVLVAQTLAVAGYWFVFWVMKTNAFASSTIQVEAVQSVIQSGPYALVRHPMYLGMITMSLATSLALGSYVALPVFALLVPVFIYRLIHEEQTLRRDLQGYGEYCARVTHRLIPFVW